MESSPHGGIPSEQPIGGTLGSRAGEGLIFLYGQAGFSKLVGFGAQLILAALLVPDDFGLVALVLSFVAFTSILQTGGLNQVLIHEHATYTSWAPSALWLALLQGVLASLLLLASARLAPIVYNDTRLVPLLLMAAIAPPFAAVSAVPHARLQIEMRYRLLALTEVLLSLTQASVAIALAVLEQGALSIIGAQVVTTILRAGIFWHVAAPPIRRPELSKWRYLAPRSIFVLLASLAFAVTGQTAPIALGAIASVTAVGLYYFAFNLTAQVAALFTSRLQTLLLPILSSLSAPASRLGVTQRATSSLALVTFPIYALLLIVAEPAIRLLYGQTWDQAIPLVLMISVAMIARVMTPPAGILLLAEGRFKTYMWVHVYSAILLVVLVAPLVALWGAVGAAGGVVVHAYLTFAGTWMFVTAGREPGLSSLLRKIAPIVLSASVSGMVAMVAGSLINFGGNEGHMMRVVASLSAGIPVYLLLASRTARHTVRDLKTQLRRAHRKGAG